MEWYNAIEKTPAHEQKVLLSSNGIYTVCNFDSARRLFVLSSNNKLTHEIGNNTYWTNFTDEHGQIESEQLQKDNTELQYMQAFLTQLVDCSHEVIIALDCNLHFLMVNKKYELIMGLKREELIGRHLFEINPKAEHTIQHEYLLRAIKGEFLQLEPLPTIAKSDLIIETFFNPLIIDNKIEGVVIISKEVRQLKKKTKKD